MNINKRPNIISRPSVNERPNANYTDWPAGAALREVGTRSALHALQAANALKYNVRRGFYVRANNVSGLRFVWANFCVNNGVETNSGGVLTITASLEYPAAANPATPGTRTQILFSGSATGTCADGAVLVSDPVLTIAPPRDAFARIWWTQQNTVGVTYTNIGPFQSIAALGDAQRQTATDFTMSGTFTDDGNTNLLHVARIMGITTSSTDILITPDSRGSGSGETGATQDASGDCGEIARAIGAKHAYWRLGQGGAQFFQLAGAQHAKQDQLLALSSPSTTIYAGGANDLGIGRTGAQIYADMQTLRARIGGRAIAATMIPRTTSTDSWITIANQTVLGTETERVNFDTLVIANANHYDSIMQYGQSVFEASSGIWQVTGSSGSAAYTRDGIHPTALASLLVPTF